jgi:TetR/AcrR family transcriptional regulator
MRKTRSSSKRGPARGAPELVRNVRRTRRRILAAAKREFALKGLAGARVDEIAARSGSNKNMIYHYFKSKDQLFTTVLEEMYETIRARQHDLELKNADPIAGIRALVEFTVQVFEEHPEFVNLLNSENLAKAQHIKRSKKIVAMYNPLVSTITDLLRRGTDSGMFNARVSAIDLYISISGIASYYISNRYTLSALFGLDVNARKRRALHRRQIADMIIAYVRAPDADHPKKSRAKPRRLGAP